MPKKLEININMEIDFKADFDLYQFICQVLDQVHIQAGYIDFNFIDNQTIQKLNQTYLKKDCPTDVLTFNLAEKEEPIWGDIYISLEQATQNARAFKNSFSEEIKLLIVHALLHLLDWQDYTESEQKKMFAEQQKILEAIKKQNLKT